MLEIDYDLLPLSPEEAQQVAQRAWALARRGKVPEIPQTGHGRVVVVNPNEGFSIHHVPDDLRRPLRRSLVSVFGGSRPLPAGTVAAEILAPDQEQLFHLVIELQSDFPALPSFVNQMARIRREHPKCRFMLHGDLPRVHEFLKDLLVEKGWSCELLFNNFPGSLLLKSEHDLTGLLMGLPRYPTLRTPFFSHLVINQGGHGEAFDVAGLKKLYSVFGVGHIEELDISGLLREKLIAVDLPLDAITAFQFREKRGEAFHAVRLGGEKILSADFAQRGLLGREVPVSDLEAVYRLRPGAPEEEILFQNVRTLRVNCFDGHVSFLWKPNLAYLPLYEVKGMRLHPPAGDQPQPLSLDDLEQPAAEPVTIETTVITEPGQPKFGDVRASIRHHFLEDYYREGLARNVKLQRYAARLKVACLGPMGAQALNLLKPFGLAKALPSKSIYYLCDSLEQVPEFRRMGERMEVTRQEIQTRLKALFQPQQPDGLKHEVVAHRLPLVRDWVQTGLPPLTKLTAEQLDTIYRELKIFVAFCETEFRRTRLSAGEELVPFSRLRETQQLALTVKHLAALVGSRYGPLPGPEDFPDFVFFGPEGDREKNGREFFLPGFAISQVFEQAENRNLFRENDFEFTVFLEEQMALLSYYQSQQPGGGPEIREKFFWDRIHGVEEELLELQKLAGMKNGGAVPPEFVRGAVETLKQEHRAETEAFRSDSETEAEKLQRNETEYFAALAAVNEVLEKTGAEEGDPLGGDDYIRTLDTQLVRASQEGLQALRGEMMAVGRKAAGLFREKTECLGEYLKAFANAQKALFLLLQAEYAKGLTGGFRAGHQPLLGTLNRLLTLPEREAAITEANLRKRHNAAKEEYSQLDVRISRSVEKSQKELGQFSAEIQRVSGKLRQPFGQKGAELPPAEMLEAISERLAWCQREIGGLAERAAQAHAGLETLRPLYRRKAELLLVLYEGENPLALLIQRRSEAGLGKAGAKKIEQPLVPPPPLPKEGDSATLANMLQGARTQLQTLATRLADFHSKPVELENAREKTNSYQDYEQKFARFRQAVRKKMQGQRALVTIKGRVALLEAEGQHLTTLVEEQMLPAQAEMAEKVYLPNASKKLSYLKKAKGLLEELEKVSFDRIQREFFDRGIFRRFFAAQFRQGAHFGLDADNPLFPKLSNVMQGIFLAHHNFRSNLREFGFRDDEITLTKLPSERLAGIRSFVEQQHALPSGERNNYLFLPATLTLPQALDVILEKEELFCGLPQLVMIFVTKFHSNQITGSDSLRERYFRALRHNIILNVDDRKIVDNPKAIAERVVRETLGCAHDLADVRFSADSHVGAPPGDS